MAYGLPYFKLENNRELVRCFEFIGHAGMIAIMCRVHKCGDSSFYLKILNFRY